MPPLLEVYNVDSSQKPPQQFLICDFCFWAASAISTRRHDIVTCPQCNATVSRLLLSDNESFTFSYDKRRGVDLAFASIRSS